VKEDTAAAAAAAEQRQYDTLMPPDEGPFVLLLVKEVKGISMLDAHWD
jgi:hypothetical protein